MSLQSVEFIAMLRVLSILYISVGLEFRWLSGNVQDLVKYDFGVLDMGDVVDTLESVMEEVAENGELFLNKDFIMNIFSDLRKQIDPFDEYLTYIFEERSSNLVGGWSTTLSEGKVVPFDLLRFELFYPSKIENRQTHRYACT